MNNCCPKCLVIDDISKLGSRVYECANLSCECHKKLFKSFEIFQPPYDQISNPPKQEKSEWEIAFDRRFPKLPTRKKGNPVDDFGIIMNEEKEIIKSFIQSLLLSEKKRWVEREKAELGRHNARILNEFQKQGTGDMPFIAYDERVCLIPAITIATKETLDILSQELE